ncbi:MAG TPA: hypothetical protein VHR64_13940 [Thermomicrobiales bacterium]|nr:hypothetical protein [Thermomicrobiales bacterium]
MATAAVTANPTTDQGPDVSELPSTGGGPTDATQSGFAWTIAALLTVVAIVGGRVMVRRNRSGEGR